MIYLDATGIRVWLDCREHYRYAYIQNVVPVKPAIHRESGLTFEQLAAQRGAVVE